MKKWQKKRGDLCFTFIGGHDEVYAELNFNGSWTWTEFVRGDPKRAAKWLREVADKIEATGKSMGKTEVPK